MSGAGEGKPVDLNRVSESAILFALRQADRCQPHLPCAPARTGRPKAALLSGREAYSSADRARHRHASTDRGRQPRRRGAGRATSVVESRRALLLGEAAHAIPRVTQLPSGHQRPIPQAERVRLRLRGRKRQRVATTRSALSESSPGDRSDPDRDGDGWGCEVWVNPVGGPVAHHGSPISRAVAFDHGDSCADGDR